MRLSSTFVSVLMLTVAGGATAMAQSASIPVDPLNATTLTVISPLVSQGLTGGVGPPLGGQAAMLVVGALTGSLSGLTTTSSTSTSTSTSSTSGR
jgi:hypothetical protein